MTHTASARPEMRRILLVLFPLFFLTYAYGRQTPANANAVSRIALALAILDEGKLSIDRYEATTCDKAFVHGHYYSDKAPGLSFASLPVLAVGYTGLRAMGKADLGVDPATGEPTGPVKLLTLLAVVFTSALSTALAATAVFWLCRRLGCGASGAVYAALAFGLATPAWGWATAYFGHALAGSCLFLGFALAVGLLESKEPVRAEVPRWMLAGGLLAYSVVVEYPLAGAVLCVVARVLGKSACLGKARLGRALLGGTLGVLPCALLLLGYNYAAFGSFFELGYQHEQGFAGMQHGFLGITYPRWDVLWAILGSPGHGILWFAPVMLLVLPAYVAAWRVTAARPYLATSAAIVAWFLALNSAYHYWDGGWSLTPRHLVPALAFACFPLCFLWDRAARTVKAGLAVLLGVSFLASMMSAAVGMDRLPDTDYPLFQQVMPEFLAGHVRNLGELLRVPGYASLLPLLLVWGWAAWRLARRLSPAKASQHLRTPAWTSSSHKVSELQPAAR